MSKKIEIDEVELQQLKAALHKALHEIEKKVDKLTKETNGNLKKEIEYWKSFVPASILRDFPFKKVQDEKAQNE